MTGKPPLDIPLGAPSSRGNLKRELDVLQSRIAQLEAKAAAVRRSIQNDSPHVARDVRKLPATATVGEVVAALDEDGAVIVEKLVSNATCTNVMQELKPFIDATLIPPNDAFAGGTTKRCGAVLARSQSSQELVGHPLLRQVCDRVLGYQELTGKAVHLPAYRPTGTGKRSKYQWIAHLTQIIDIGPGGAAQPIHTDEGWCEHTFAGELELEISTIWALNDFTEVNGATRVVPGSHLPGQGPRGENGFELHHSTCAEMPAGSVLMYLGSTYHGGGANKTDKSRVALNVDYCVGFLRQEENQYLACPPEHARKLPKDLQNIIGYKMGGYALGYVADSLPPSATLSPGFDVTIPGSGNEHSPFAPRTKSRL